jgi:AcrR family transcriptional regulator
MKRAGAIATYNSSLRDAQAAGTRQQILESVAALIERGEEPTYAAIAKQAAVQERTVYRHFPSKDELYEAFWWMVVDARLGSTGYDASDLGSLLRDVETTFRAFDGNVELVTAMLHSKHGLAIRLSTNDRRKAMFVRVVKNEIPSADAQTHERAAAITQLLYSGMAWHSMRAYWGMDSEESSACVAQALRAMFAELRRASGKRAARSPGVRANPRRSTAKKEVRSRT